MDFDLGNHIVYEVGKQFIIIMWHFSQYKEYQNQVIKNFFFI